MAGDFAACAYSRRSRAPSGRGDVRATQEGPRYAPRGDFMYVEDVTIADWVISTDDPPRCA